MTPTEQDKELRAAVKQILKDGFDYYILERKNTSSDMKPLDTYCTEHLMQLITADRKHVALESEMNAWKQVRKSYPKKQTLQGNAVSKLTLADVDRKITELKAQQEEV